MDRDVKQPVAWELNGRLRELVEMRPNMQVAEWRHRFSEFWPDSWDHLSQPEARLEMFDSLQVKGLAERRFASYLDYIKTHNEGWRAIFADRNYACSAFPICDIAVCHRKSIGHRRGYQDRNGRDVSPHPVRSHFFHRSELSKVLNEVHQADMDQRMHDEAIDIMYGHLLPHKLGFYILDKCQMCKEEFEALRIYDPKEYIPHYREYDENKRLKFEYDIGVMGKDGKLLAALEAKNTHKMGSRKRNNLDNNGYPWVEYDVSATLKNVRKAVHTNLKGWLAIEALLLKIGHSGATHCDKCAEEIERKRAEEEKRHRLRKSANEGAQLGRRAMNEIVEPAGREVEYISNMLVNIDAGFSAATLDKAEFALAESENDLREIVDRLGEAEQVAAQLREVANEFDRLPASRPETAFCTKTGYYLDATSNELAVRGYSALYEAIDHVQQKCHAAFELINLKRGELESQRQWLDPDPIEN